MASFFHNPKMLHNARKRTRIRVDSTENIMSDMSMDISDITLEIEKLNRGCANPEQGMKDTNRLLKEIDQQMEMSFEIMEDRQSMVRQFLKDRDSADKNHRQRAANMMSQFNKKISTMESYLNVKGITKKINQTSMTQTDVIQTSNAEQQTCIEDVLPANQDMQEVVKSFTKDMREVIHKQLWKEKQAILLEFEAGRKVLDQNEIEELLFEISEKLKHRKVDRMIVDLLKEEIDPVVKDDILKKKDDLIQWMMKDDEISDGNNVVVANVGDEFNHKLIDIRNSLKRKPEASLSSESNVSELKNSIRQIDSLEASLNSILKDIRSILKIDEDEVLQLIHDVIENEPQNTNQVTKDETISHVIQNYVKINLSESNDVRTRALVQDYVALKAEVSCAERKLHESLSQIFPDCKKDLLEINFQELILKNENLMQKREKMCHDVIDKKSGCLLDNSLTNSAPDWMKHFFITNETLETIKPKLGEGLCRALFKTGLASDIQAVEYVHYQDRTMDDILKEYEEEIFQLRNDHCESKAYREVIEIMTTGNNNRDVVEKLRNKLKQTEDALCDHIPKMQRVKDELQRLKSEKDEVTATEEDIMSKKTKLQLKLGRFDEDIAHHFLAMERKKEKVDLELQIAACADEIQKVETKLTSIEEKSAADTSVTQEKRSLMTQLSILKENLQKLIPYINRNSSKYQSTDMPKSFPDSIEISSVIQTRLELSKKLIETENNIQDIITSNGYESSEDDSCTESDQFTIEANISSLQMDGTNASLNQQLREIEAELSCVNQQMEKDHLKVDDIKNLKITSEKLNVALSNIEKQLKFQHNSAETTGSTTRELERLKTKSADLKAKLKEDGVNDFEYNQGDMENLLKAKLQLDDKLHRIIERVTDDKETRKLIRESMKQLIVAGDRAKNSILNLEEDIMKMTDVQSLGKHGNIFDQLVDTEKHILQTKSEGLNKLASFAYNNLNMFLLAMKEQASRRLNEFHSIEAKKEDLSADEKKVLLNELQTIIDDISNTFSDLTSIEEFRSKRVISNNSMTLMKTISQKRNELLSNLEDIDRVIENNESGTDESQLKQALDQKVEIKLELSELEERIDTREAALKGRLEKLTEIKFALQQRFYNSITTDDFKKVIKIFEAENALDVCEEGEINKLLTKRADVHDEICKCLERKDCQETGLLFKELDKVDSEINVIIHQLVIKQESMSTENPLAILVKKDALIEALQGRKVLKNILQHSKWMAKENVEVNEKSIKQTYEHLQVAEELRVTLKNFHKRNLDFHHLDVMKELKDLNDRKLNALLKNIKQMNLFIERGRKVEKTKDQSDTPGSSEIQYILSNSEKINQELDEVEPSYLEEIKSNENVLLAKSCVKELSRKPTTLDSYLQDRENKLNRLFLVIKHLEKDSIDDLERTELEKEKSSLETVIEEIDEKIIEGDFDDDSSIETPTRSFSPRSTSSRNSMTYVLDEREQLMKHIFQLQKKEDFLRESEDILNKQSTLKDVQERKERLCKKLKILDERINQVKDISDDTVVEEIVNESVNTTIHIADRDEYEDALQNLRDELNAGQFNTSSSPHVYTNIKALLNNSEEMEMLNTVQKLDERLHMENVKKRLKSMEEKQAEMMKNIKRNKITDALRMQARKKKKALAWITEKINMISKRNELETSATEIQMLLQNSGGECNKSDSNRGGEKCDVNIETPKGKEGMHTKQLKREKVTIEKRLDGINVMLYQYSNALENKIKEIEREIEDRHKQQENMTNYKHILETLKTKKNDLENRAFQIQELIERANNTSLMDLLTVRRSTVEEFTQIDDNLLWEVQEKKSMLAESLKMYFDENKHCIQWQRQLDTRLKILNEKIEVMESADVQVKDCEYLTEMKSLLGHKLFEILSDKGKIPEEKYLQNLLSCLEDRTVSDYIKEMSTLCSVQNEQIEELKMKVSENKDKSEQITQLENELIEAYENLYTAEEFKKRMKEKLGGKLFDIVVPNDADSANTKHINEGGHFKRLRKFLKESEESLEMVLQKQYFDSYDQKDKTLDELAKEKKRLKIEVNCKENEIQLLKSREDEFCSETESLRDNLQQCAQKTNTINEQATKLKEDHERTKERFESLTQEYEQLKFEYDELVDKIDEHDKMKENMTVISGECTELKSELTSKEMEAKETCFQLSELRKDLKESQDEVKELNEAKLTSQTEIRNLKDETGILNQELSCLRNLNLQERDSTDEVWSERLKDVTDALKKSHETMEKSQDDRMKLQEELETLRKKLKRVTREKATLQESLEKESKSFLKVEDELTSLKQKEKCSNREMHKHCQVIEKHEKDLKNYKTQTTFLEKQNADLQNSFNELKDKYQAMSIKHQNEVTKASKELKVVKHRMEEQRSELEKMRNEGEYLKEGDLRKLTEALENKRVEYETEIKTLRHEMTETKKLRETDISELMKRNSHLDEKIVNLTSENDTLLKKLHDLDESFETELSDTRRDMNEKYGKSIDKLNEKIRHMADELNTLEKLKDDADKENTDLRKQIDNLGKQAKEREMIVETEFRSYQVKESSISVELEAMKLENNELQEQILELKQQTRKIAALERTEREVNEKNRQLKMATVQLEQERQQFEKNVSEQMKKFLLEDQKNSRLDDRVSLNLLKATQNERDKISNDLIDTKHELMHSRNELRKIKLTLRQKEDEYIAEQKKMLQIYEEEQKNKADETRRVHSKEKETILKMYTEERNKWEDEMKILKHNLQEENLRKLSEQRADFEKELEVRLDKYLKQNDNEIDELQDQVDVLKNQKTELINQFEKEKTNLKKAHENEIHTLEETIRRLLNNLVKFKEKRNRLRHSHQDEILELEERFYAERERLEERREQELETLKIKLQKSHNVGLHNVKTMLNTTLEDLVTETTKKYDPVKSAMSKFTLDDLKELLHMGDLSDILDSEYEAEQDMIKESVRSQYKAKLRNETDTLLKRLLELSEELDSLRGYS